MKEGDVPELPNDLSSKDRTALQRIEDILLEINRLKKEINIVNSLYETVGRSVQSSEDPAELQILAQKARELKQKMQDIEKQIEPLEKGMLSIVDQLSIKGRKYYQGLKK